MPIRSERVAHPTRVRRVRLIQARTSAAELLAADLRGAGYVVETAPVKGPADLRALAADPPSAVVIDLSRAPSHGRDVALAIREARATRHVPLVFVDGDKICAIDTTWSGLKFARRKP